MELTPEITLKVTLEGYPTRVRDWFSLYLSRTRRETGTVAQVEIPPVSFSPSYLSLGLTVSRRQPLYKQSEKFESITCVPSCDHWDLREADLTFAGHNLQDVGTTGGEILPEDPSTNSHSSPPPSQPKPVERAGIPSGQVSKQNRTSFPLKPSKGVLN